jgi:hypothetical protein
MKKYASLLLFALLLNGCDDGDLTVDTIDFEDVTTTTSCDTTNTLIYKLKTQEALLLQMLPKSIINEDQDTIVYNIDNSNYRVFYRAYDGEVARENLCGIIPPKTPNVTEEWIGIAGKIQIATSAQYKSPAPTDGHTEIIGYNHNIIFKNITFSKPSGPQIEVEYPFGDFKTEVTPVVVNFTNPQVAKRCELTKKVYNDNGSSSLAIENFDASLFGNEPTPVGKPKTALINQNGKNNLYYKVYATLLPVKTEDYICAATPPSSPIVRDTWVGVDGKENVSGIIEVTTTSAGTTLYHKVVLKNVTLKKGNNTFKLATEFILGTITVTP